MKILFVGNAESREAFDRAMGITEAVCFVNSSENELESITEFSRQFDWVIVDNRCAGRGWDAAPLSPSDISKRAGLNDWHTAGFQSVSSESDQGVVISFHAPVRRRTRKVV